MNRLSCIHHGLFAYARGGKELDWIDIKKESAPVCGRKCLSTIIILAMASAIILGSTASLLAESFIWSAQVSGTPVLLSAMRARDSSHAWAVGQAGTIRYTSNGGATWAAQASGTGEDLQGISSTGPTHAWAVGDHGEIRVTLNGGASWSHQNSGVADDLKHGGALRPLTG